MHKINKIWLKSTVCFLFCSALLLFFSFINFLFCSFLRMAKHRKSNLTMASETIVEFSFAVLRHYTFSLPQSMEIKF